MKILMPIRSGRHAETKHEAAGKFKALLEEFYSNSPERLKASLFGLGLTGQKTCQRFGTGLITILAVDRYHDGGRWTSRSVKPLLASGSL